MKVETIMRNLLTVTASITIIIIKREITSASKGI